MTHLQLLFCLPFYKLHTKFFIILFVLRKAKTLPIIFWYIFHFILISAIIVDNNKQSNINHCFNKRMRLFQL